MNTGKQFEADFKASVPKDVWCYRLNDKAKCKYRKEKHITDMVDAMGYSGQTAHVIVNYRSVNRTFAIPASKVLAFRYNESRKSIPWKWAEQEGIEVKAKRLRVHWRYDVDGLLKRLEKENATV